ncbi:hypothetical protein [Flavobacterium soyangense]|uniref:Uncharacterized protein n=1 Tax=Flavobacterium soyangense TaxID=2023265 RepID=A0A930XV47_9FLAO|nr:hypothetical protein [Flavobacterium soyangense]MBF2709260.1 hypothetical protein [Flavobacterium soyangense]
MKKHLGFVNTFVIILTIILFGVALFTTGFTHDLLLEAGVLLVSIKLIMMSYKNSIFNKELLNKIEEISEKLDKIKNV